MEVPPCVKNLYSKMSTHEFDGSFFECLGLIKQMDEVGALAHAGVTLDEVIHALSCVAARVFKEEDTRKGDVTGYTKVTKSKMIQISNQDYDERMAVVMAMPLKKRKNFKSTLTDKRGVRTKLRFIDDKLQNYDLETNQFVEVLCPRTTADDGAFIPASPVGWMIMIAAHLNNAQLHQNTMDFKERQNHTGNHYRNHTTKVSARAYGRNM